MGGFARLRRTFVYNLLGQSEKNRNDNRSFERLAEDDEENGNGK